MEIRQTEPTTNHAGPNSPLTAEAVRSEWQPIDTAPKDGLFLMAVESGAERRVFVTQADYPPTGFRWITTHGLWWDGLHSDWTPTHWMPLPDPPASLSPSPPMGGEG